MNTHRPMNVRRHHRAACSIALAAVAALSIVTAAAGQEYRPIDGRGNNIVHPHWGSAGSTLLRKAGDDYADGVSAMAGPDRPDARVVSNAIVDQAGKRMINDRLMSAMVHLWGQFIDHDLDLTPAGGTEPIAIPIPAGDPDFDPAGTGDVMIFTSRSIFDPQTGDSLGNPREQVNIITAWLDGSMVYGSDEETASKLRTHRDGKLKVGHGDLLPLNDEANFPRGGLPMEGGGLVPAHECFAAGDVRANENIALTAMHTLFVREHNTQAERIARAIPSLDDEEIYQRARAWVIAEIQAITYNEWLPALLGPGEYAAGTFDPTVNPGIANEFSAAAFRVGHTLLGDGVEFLNELGDPMAEPVPLAFAFFNPPLVTENGIEPLLKFAASDAASEVDNQIVDGLRNFLFGRPGAGGLDLACLNIIRGRDHGLGDYRQVRRAYGMPRINSFSDVTPDGEIQATLGALYGDVHDIDPWVGLLAEAHVPGCSVGPTLRAILMDQFSRLARADRFWYERTFNGRDLARLRSTRLSDVIRRNTTLSNIQSNVFFFDSSIAGVAFVDENANGTCESNEARLADMTVRLVADGTGRVVTRVMTDEDGRYAIGVQDGLLTGSYVVQLLGSDGGVLAESLAISVTCGDEHYQNVDLGAQQK